MEYANINIFKPKTKKSTIEGKVKQIINTYHEKGRMDPVLVDSDYNILSGEETYWAGKEIGLPYLLSERKRSFRANSVFPPRLLVEITSKCNSLCKMCPRNYLTREKKHMESALFKKVIDEISKCPNDGLWLYNLGEPLLHPDFFDLLNYTQNYPQIRPLWLSTNGMLLTEKVSEKILDSELDYLNFSLNALDEETYKKISPMLDFQSVMANLHNFYKMKKGRKQRKPFLRVQIIDQPEIHHQIQQFKEEWGPKADIISINILAEFTGQSSIREKQKIINKKKYKCKRIDRGFLYILSNGEVTICATDFDGDLSAGNVKNMSIKEIWDSDKYNEMVEKISRGDVDDYPICQNCLDSQLG